MFYSVRRMFKLFFHFTVFLFSGLATQADTLDGSSIFSFNKSIEEITSKLSAEENFHFEAGIYHILFSDEKYNGIPPRFLPVYLKQAFVSSLEKLDGLYFATVIETGKANLLHPEFLDSMLSVGKMGNAEKLLIEAIEDDPKRASALLRDISGKYVRAECDEAFFDSPVFSSDPYLKLFPEGSENNASTLVEYLTKPRGSVPDQKLEKLEILGLPPTTFLSHEPQVNFWRSRNSLGQGVYQLTISTNLTFGKNYFKWLAMSLTEKHIPESTCERRYKDHNDYLMSVNGADIQIDNTFTTEIWKCGRIDLGIGSKGFKTKIGKTTSSQTFSISTELDPDEYVLNFEFSAEDEKLGVLENINQSLDFGIGTSRLNGLSNASGLDWKQVATATQFDTVQSLRNRKMSYIGGDASDLALYVEAKLLNPLNLYEACVAAEDMVSEGPFILPANILVDAVFLFSEKEGNLR
ncbi:hypothetical protein [Pelagimonas varians]|uniref:Uncharacterized protein n=1 Tax=Pelagimonas varians TaxID=696760 RepID=A0A238KH35_9RHOB|nr:hypothetical protein [Pelagimonas varians]PYG32259.1 hypothetical protein C8N36_1034 [Pelagimonas varians]SMX42149.1 hypothetical protein PEV8663_02426 [Pelagimonas varians]